MELCGLTKSFGRVDAVRGIDLRIDPGEIVAVLGPNGAGKSTTTEMILGITAPDEGTVRVFGQDPQAAVHAGRVGAMLQAGALLLRRDGCRRAAADARACTGTRCRWLG